MYFVIIGTDKAESVEKRLAVRLAHLERLKILHDEGRLLTAGPCPIGSTPQDGFYGSIIIADFESYDAAVLWASEDPYKHNDVYQSIDIRPFSKVF